MRMILSIALLCSLSVAAAFAQDLGGGMEEGMGGYGEMGSMGYEREQPTTKFVILLGPNLKPGDVPFLDAYEMARGTGRNFDTNLIPVETISVDLKTPLPTKPGISVHVEYPSSLPDGQTVADLESRIRTEAIRFGITTVEATPVETADKVKVFLRVGLPNGDLSNVNIKKITAAAVALAPENPMIQVFNEAPLRAKRDRETRMAGMGGMSDMGGMGGMDGMGMDAGMGMGSMLGMDAGMSMDADMGDMSGAGSGGSDQATETPVWAEPEGVINTNDTYLAWSPGTAAARSVQTGDSWIEVRLGNEKMTAPMIEDKVCAFFCDNKAYAFSAKVGCWDVLPLGSPPDKLPRLVLDPQSAVIVADDDIHIFTAASGRWSSRSKASAASPTSEMSSSVSTFGGPSQPSDPASTYEGTGQNASVLPGMTSPEAEIEKLAMKYKTTSDDTEKAEFRQHLRDKISDEFEARQTWHVAEAELLAKKLALIEDQIKLRKQNSEAIIQQRMNKLLGEQRK